ncbi:MAG: class I SAM-dependent methyltransferase [Acidimicrobiia bacterium]|nr:class I SAM-dependent methyltransferase [Acidimicrobiia bacterium]
MTSYFDQHYLLTHGQSHTEDGSRAEAFVAVRLAGVSPGARILDAPCGFGRHAIPLAEAGFDVVGLDFSESLLAEARRRMGRAGPELVHGDLRALPFAEASFDRPLSLQLARLPRRGRRSADAAGAPAGAAPRVARLVLRSTTATGSRRRFVPAPSLELPDGSVSVAESEFDVVSGVLTVRETRSEPGAVTSRADVFAADLHGDRARQAHRLRRVRKDRLLRRSVGSPSRLDAPMVVILAGSGQPVAYAASSAIVVPDRRRPARVLRVPALRVVREQPEQHLGDDRAADDAEGVGLRPASRTP